MVYHLEGKDHTFQDKKNDHDHLFNKQNVTQMFSVHCRYELHCPIEKVEKDIAELL